MKTSFTDSIEDDASSSNTFVIKTPNGNYVKIGVKQLVKNMSSASKFSVVNGALKFGTHFVKADGLGLRHPTMLKQSLDEPKHNNTILVVDNNLHLRTFGGCAIDIYDMSSLSLYLWTYNGNVNQRFEFVEAPSTDSGSGTDVMKYITLHDIDGKKVVFNSNTSKTGTFPFSWHNEQKHSVTLTQPIFVGSGRFDAKQTAVGVVLLFKEEDFKDVQNTIHKRAFGTDYVTWSKLQLIMFDESTFIPVGKWTFVWKFPADLNGLHSFKTVQNVPIPVGMYPMYDDNYWSPSEHFSVPLFPFGIHVEKNRYDIPGYKAVHCLKSYDGVRVACMGTAYFVRNFDDVTLQERKKIREMLEELFNQTGIYVFSCNGQHHSIVFYMDIQSGVNTLLTPDKFAKILRDDVRGETLVKILRKYIQIRFQR